VDGTDRDYGTLRLNRHLVTSSSIREQPLLVVVAKEKFNNKANLNKA
jgi:hypothetical protein